MTSSPELGIYIVGGKSAILASSPNATTWTSRTVSFSTNGVVASAWSPEQGRFVITDLFMQLLLQDASAELTADGYATDISTEKPSNLRSDEIYRRFVALLDRVAARSNSRG